MISQKTALEIYRFPDWRDQWQVWPEESGNEKMEFLHEPLENSSEVEKK